MRDKLRDVQATTIERLLGFPVSTFDRRGPFRLFGDFGNGAELLGRADTLAATCELMPSALFGPTLPDYDADVIDEMPLLEGEPLACRALVYELAEEQMMQRTRDPKALVYLASVLTDYPALRLVVAWEAVPHRQDAAIGIFIET